MQNHPPLIRYLRGWYYLESFLVAAVAALFAIRIFLRLTGYPQIGGRGLHIAHMLWGGLMMLAAIVILFAFLGRGARRTAAVLGGFGFGTFIDEIGKFVTRDNNYFFQPAVALIYVVFMATFLVVQAIRKTIRHNPEEYLANAVHEVEEVARNDLTEEGKARALAYLNRSDPHHPLVPALRLVLAETGSVPDHQPRAMHRGKAFLRALYRKLVKRPSFSKAVAAFFAVRLALELAQGVLLFSILTMHWEAAIQRGLFGMLARRFENAAFADCAQLFSSLVAGVFTLIGIMWIRSSRLFAFEMFERSVLVSIFLTQVFSFYKEQFAAVFVLAADILILAAVRFALEQEHLSHLTHKAERAPLDC